MSTETKPYREKARILFCVGVMDSSVIIATDSAWVYSDIQSISDGAEDIGVNDLPIEPGLYLWEGTMATSAYETGYGIETETDYSGNSRPVSGSELAELLAMKPPPSPVPDLEDMLTIDTGNPVA